MEKKNKLSVMWCIFAAFLSSIAISISGEIIEQGTLLQYLCSEIRGIEIEYLLILIGLSIFYCKYNNKLIEMKHWIIHLLSLLFAIFMLIGKSYSRYNSSKFFTYNLQQVILASIVFCGFYILFIYCLKLIYYYLNERNTCELKGARKIDFSEKSYLLTAFGIIMICWLPYLIIHYPASVPHDGYVQLNQALGIEAMTNHHPWIVSVFFGIVFKCGRVINDNFGAFLLAFVLYIIQAYCYAYICNKLKQWSDAKWLYNGSLAFFAMVPVFGAYAPSIIKDGLYTALFAVFITLYVERLLYAKITNSVKDDLKKYGVLVVIGILVCFSRNNGVYSVVPAFLILFFFVMKEKKMIVFLSLMIVCVMYFGVGDALANKMNVEDGSIKEMLSVPFQQTARYLKTYPEEVSENEKEAIDIILNYDKIKKNYKPDISDPVKNTYDNNSDSQDLINYFKVWYRMFFKHPEVYVSATLNNTYGYYYPFHNCNALGAYQAYIKGEPVATGDLDIYYVFPESVRKIVDDYAEIWRVIPGLSQSVNPATYTWMLMIGIGYLIIRKRWKHVIALIPAALNIAVSIVSPVNGLLRYALPLIACIPVLIYWCLYKEYSGE